MSTKTATTTTTATASLANPVDAIATMPAATKRRSLFEIANEFAAAFNALSEAGEEGDGEIPNDLATAFDRVEMEIGKKLDNCYKVLRTLETDAAAADEELDRLTRLVTARRRRAEWFKRYVLDSMIAAGVRKHESATCMMRVQRNSQPSVRLEGEVVPVQFMRVKTVCELDSKKAVSAWKDGEPLPDQVLVIEGCHLRTGVGK
jgi:hypothetical protein